MVLDGTTMMIRVLKAVSILALLATGPVLWLGIVRIGRDCPRPEVLQTPSVVERFQQSNYSQTGNSRPPSSPLVEQAQRFASYLNPAKTAAPGTRSSHAEGSPAGLAEAVTIPTAKVAPLSAPASASAFSLQFTVQGISYYREDPEQSMALVCEPGAGRRWVRQGTQMGHFTIEHIEMDTITCREGTRTHLVALACDKTPAISPGASEEISGSQPMAEPMPAVPAPPPLRGLRQMPLARVAAKTGLPASPIPLPTLGLGESQ